MTNAAIHPVPVKQKDRDEQLFMAGILLGSLSGILGTVLIFASGNPENIGLFFPALVASMVGLFLNVRNASRRARIICYAIWAPLFAVSLIYTLAERSVTAGTVLWLVGYAAIFVVPYAPFPGMEALLRKVGGGGQER